MFRAISSFMNIWGSPTHQASSSVPATPDETESASPVEIPNTKESDKSQGNPTAAASSNYAGRSLLQPKRQQDRQRIPIRPKATKA